MTHCPAILLDIEGTTTPSPFVDDVLFPYARRRLRTYLDTHLEAPHLREPIEQLHDERQHDVARGDMPPGWRDDDRAHLVTSVVTYAEWLIEHFRRPSGVNALQRDLKTRGYEDRSFRGQVFPDVPLALARRREAGLVVAVFSTSSVLAQQVLLSTIMYGDLTHWIDAHFDAGAGSKESPDSYRRTAESLECAPEELLFISDVTGELDAAREAGCDTRLCLRPESLEHGEPPGDHRTIDDLNGVS